MIRVEIGSKRNRPRLQLGSGMMGYIYDWDSKGVKTLISPLAQVRHCDHSDSLRITTGGSYLIRCVVKLTRDSNCSVNVTNNVSKLN